MPNATAEARARTNTALLIGLTLLTGGLFKLSAFGREAFIAAKFGLSSATDAYFGLQQLPLTVATFMFGSFALAFTPMYAESRRRGAVLWLRGLTFYAVVLGCILTGCVLLAAPLLLRIFVSSSASQTLSTLAVLSVCFVPIVCTGIWAGMCTARGQNLRALTMTGLPYLLMTLVLLALYAVHLLNELSLPMSMAAGFGLVGAYSLFCMWGSSDGKPRAAGSIFFVWRVPEFRHFLRQLASSSSENVGFAANQLLMVYFLARAGTGMVSANNCAMRIGMLGYGLLAQPLAQLVQARLCAAEQKDRAELFRRWLLVVATGILTLAVVLYASSDSIVRIVYMHGKFRSAELAKVAGILPAWIAYFVVMSLNVTAARYLFTTLQGAVYLRHMLSAYAVANLLRFAVAGSVSTPWIIWCSVAAEGCALLANLRSCFGKGHTVHAATNLLTHAGAGLVTGPIR